MKKGRREKRMVIAGRNNGRNRTTYQQIESAGIQAGRPVAEQQNSTHHPNNMQVKAWAEQHRNSKPPPPTSPVRKTKHVLVYGNGYKA
jgi:hypothetical protein